jgi:hypothetical protein
MQLRSLLRTNPEYTALVQELAKLEIRTDMDLLSYVGDGAGSSDSTASTSAIAGNGIWNGHSLAFELYKALPQGTISLNDLAEFVKRVCKLGAAKGCDALSLLKAQDALAAAAPPVSFETGVPAIDELVGGFKGPALYEVAGDDGSGRSVR